MTCMYKIIQHIERVTCMHGASGEPSCVRRRQLHPQKSRNKYICIRINKLSIA